MMGKRYSIEDVIAMEKRIAYLESCLKRIAEHPHCQDPGDKPLHDIHQIVIWATECGHADGHRCAAEIAREGFK